MKFLFLVAAIGEFAIAGNGVIDVLPARICFIVGMLLLVIATS